MTERWFEKAASEGRSFLFEHEGYELLKDWGIDPPIWRWIARPEETKQALEQIPGNDVVLKIVHSKIFHKTDVGGVRVVSKSDARSQVNAFFEGGLREGLVGILAVEKLDVRGALGSEFILGTRWSREFGPILLFGLGGVDSELLSNKLSASESRWIQPVALDDETTQQNLSRRSLLSDLLLGRARGREPLTSAEALQAILGKFEEMAEHYSPLNPTARFWIDELEANPVCFRNGTAVPLDALVRFKRADAHKRPQPQKKLNLRSFLQPKTIAVMGVSSKDQNVGRIILGNLLNGSRSSQDLCIIKPKEREIDGVRCWPSIRDLPTSCDLLIVSVPAPQVPGVLREAAESRKVQSILVTTGGLGEKSGSTSLEETNDCHIPIVGPNSLGAISRPGNYDTIFIPKERLPRDLGHPLGKSVAILSQSGAFMITRMNRMGGFVPRYAISTGNQAQVSVVDFIDELSNDPEVRVFGCYVESLKDLEGLRLTKLIRSLRQDGRDVVFYKAGRSPEGRNAASGHTAAIAGDWPVTEQILSDAGGLVARTFQEWSGFLILSACLGGKSVGQARLGVVSNAGYEVVALADQLNTENRSLSLAKLDSKTISTLERVMEKYGLSQLQDIKNPLDVTPMAPDEAHIDALTALAADPNVDILFEGCVPLTARMNTLEVSENSFSWRLSEMANGCKKPLITSIDAGSLYDPLADSLLRNGVPVFRSTDEAVRILSRWVRLPS